MESRTRSIKLEQLKIESPCTESWEGMHGDGKARFCDKCQLHVHNLSAMNKEEAEELVGSRTGRMCVRYEVTGDTIETADRVVSEKRSWRRWGGMAAMALAYVGLSGLIALGGDDRRARMGDVACPPAKPEKPSTQPTEKDATVPAIDPAPAGPERVLLMGKMAAPATQPAKDPVVVAPKVEEKPMVMGGLPAPQQVKADPIVKDVPARLDAANPDAIKAVAPAPQPRQLMGEISVPVRPAKQDPASSKIVDAKKTDAPASTQPSM